MKTAPCARFGMRIRPKIREKPEDSKNSRPPKATLLRVWISQNCIGSASWTSRRYDTHFLSTSWCRMVLLFEIARRRIIARINWVFKKRLGVVGPKLTDIRIGAHDGIHELTTLADHLANVDVPDHVSILVERDRSAHRIWHLNGTQRRHEGVLVLDSAAHGLDRSFQHSPVSVGGRCIKSRINLID